MVVRVGFSTFATAFILHQSTMNSIIAHIMLFLLPSTAIMAQQKLVVVNVESKVPIRDVKICTDNGQEMRTAWDGQFIVPDSFHRIDFIHPDFERRYVLRGELHSDTIFLIPNVNALHEVVIYGKRRRFDDRMAMILKPSPQQIERDKMPQYVPAGINPFGLLKLIYDLTLRDKVKDKARRKKALKEVRRKEAELQQKWDSLKPSPAK